MDITTVQDVVSMLPAAIGITFAMGLLLSIVVWLFRFLERKIDGR